MASYIGNTPLAQATQTRQSLEAVAGQTTFVTTGYSPNYVDVYLNGVHLEPIDFVAGDGINIELLSPAEAQDIVTVVAFSTFDVGDTFNLAEKTYVDEAIAAIDVTDELNTVTAAYQADDVTNLAAAKAYADAGDVSAIQDAEDYTDLGVDRAITTAAADATTKSNSALASAKQYTDQEITALNAIVTDNVTNSQAYTDSALTAANSYTDTEIASLVSTAPTTLDTLNELAAALGDDPNFATTVSGQIGTAQSTADTALTNANAALAKDPTLTLTGDATGSATFTNLGNATLNVTVADDSHNHTIANVDGLQTALNGKVDDSQVLTNVPAGAVFTDTVYTHPRDGAGNQGALTGGLVYAAIDINTEGHVTGTSLRNLTATDVNAAPSNHNHDSLYTKVVSNRLYLNGNQIALDALKSTSIDTSFLNGSSSISNGGIDVQTPTAITHNGNNTALRVYDRRDLPLVSSSYSHFKVDRQGDATPVLDVYTQRFHNAFFGTTDTMVAKLDGNKMFHEGYHPNADKWTTARTLTLTGDVTGSVSWDGSANVSMTTEGGAKEGIFWENDTTVTSSYTITAGKNAMTAGPVTIANGATVTIPDGSTWTVI